MTENVHTGHRKRLKERFLRDGLSSFTERETLEMLLMYAIPQKDVSPLAGSLLERFGSLAGVLDAEGRALTECEGVGEHAALLLQLMPQLFGRYEQSRLGERPRITDPAGAARYAATLFPGSREERLYMVCLDASGRVTGSALIAKGTLDEVPVYPREVVEQALRMRAHAVLLAHNHPGGTPEPSKADVETTRSIINALSVVNIRVLDHMVVSGRGTYSMAKNALTGAVLTDAGICRERTVSALAKSALGLEWDGEKT